MKTTIKTIVTAAILSAAFAGIASAQLRVLRPSSGGTGIGSAIVGQIGTCLKVLTASPFTYELGTCSSGGGTVSTSTPDVSGYATFFTSNSATPATIGGDSAFFWNNTNKRLGIGSTSPWAQVSINPNGVTGPTFAIGSSSKTTFLVNSAGQVGISGKSTFGVLPSDLTSLPNYDFLVFHDDGAGNPNGFGFNIASHQLCGSASLIGTNGSCIDFYANAGGLELSTVLANKGVNIANSPFGVGTSTPWAFLSVNPNGIGSGVPVVAIGSSTGTLLLLESNGKLSLNTGLGNANQTFLGFSNGTISGSIRQRASDNALGIRTETANTSFSVGAGGQDVLNVYSTSGAQTAIGIGTTTPWGYLSVNPNAFTLGPEFAIGSSSRTDMVVTTAGNTGIGTSSPYATLSANSSTSTVGTAFAVGNTASTSLSVQNQTGWVGVNTPNPNSMLTVQGDNIANSSVNAFSVYLNAAKTEGISVTYPSSIARLSFIGNGSYIQDGTGLGISSNGPGSYSYSISSGQNTTGFAITNVNSRTATAGTSVGFSQIETFAPTSGTAVFNDINFAPTINQTGGANGITRGLYINPTVTAAADFRSIETTVGNETFNTTSGNLGIGTTSPSRLLSVQGAEYITAQRYDTNGSAGTNGQVLTSTGSATAWSSAFTNATSTALLLAQTASIASVNTYTPTASSTYMVMVTTDVTAEAVQTLTVSVTYTDTGGTSRTQNFFGMGLTTAAIGSTGDSNFPPMVIRPLKNTAITVATTVGGVGSISYNIDASIIPVSTQ